MSSVQQKITRNTKTQEGMAHSKEKNNSVESVSKIDLMADIVHKDFQTAALMILKELKKNVGEVMKMIFEQNRSINEKIESLKRNKKILELKSIVIEMKNSLDGFKDRFGQAEERISKLEDETM